MINYLFGYIQYLKEFGCDIKQPQLLYSHYKIRKAIVETVWCELKQKAIVPPEQNNKGILVWDVHGTQNGFITSRH